MKGIFLAGCLLAFIHATAQQTVTISGKAQGTYYIVKYLGKDSTSLKPEVESLFRQIDRSLSLYQPGSLINRFNEGEKVVMDAYMRPVVRKAQEVSRITDGMFDITVKPLVDLWGFGVVRHKKGRPSDADIQQTLRRVGYEKLIIRAKYLLKKHPGVEIDCNGIAQGYTTDVIAKFLQSRGIRNYLVDVGGELAAKGHNDKNQPWSVGIERKDGNEGNGALLHLSDRAVATSGNYQRFFDEGGTRFAHTIHPKTGEAVHNNIITVTVTAPDAMTADAYDNALILLGVEKGIEFIRQHPKLKLEAFFIYKDADGSIREKYSEGFFTVH
ncbi:FAD:protein FMN transferase [Chitinophaga rhizosphaerae]|uniref:FAD:protein FMN transferase n=1 Tax=Chitinophaga rhizosphaerae TaxID=1864947 RepID=UPI0013DEFDD0|nr:FAD:protein FMN transferase [Chitinophaga rhizosphaerae]